MENKKLIKAIIDKFNKDNENYSVFLHEEQVEVWDDKCMSGKFGGVEIITALYAVGISSYLNYSVSINKIQLIIPL
jgi:hypothetical protein